MSFQADIADDFATVVDNPEAVTVAIKRAGEKVGVPIPIANRSAANLRLSIYSGVQIQGNELTWSIPSNAMTLSGFTYGMQNGDTITDSTGVVFGVISAALMTMATRWDCVCRPVPKSHEKSARCRPS